MGRACTLSNCSSIALTIFVWPTTAAPGNEYGTGTWFNWVKTYSALAGCLGFMAILLDPKDVRNCRWMENLFGQADIRITGNRLWGFYFVVNIPVVKS